MSGAALLSTAKSENLLQKNWDLSNGKTCLKNGNESYLFCKNIHTKIYLAAKTHTASVAGGTGYSDYSLDLLVWIFSLPEKKKKKVSTDTKNTND